MAVVEDIRRSIWHAFSALARGDDGQVAKSRLKVLTNNIGRALGNDKAEEIVRDDTEDNLTFTEYFAIISSELLQPDTSEVTLTPAICSEIDKICWFLCDGHYRRCSKVADINSALNSDDLFKMWKVFNFLARVDLDSTEDSLHTATLPLKVDVEEAHRISSLIRHAVGFSSLEIPAVDPSEDDDSSGDKFAVDFVEFIIIVCTVAMEQEISGDVIREGISCVYEEILHDIIKKGYLEKFGNHVTHWKRRWFCLSAKELRYYTTDKERELKGTIEVCVNFRPEILPQPSGHKLSRFKLHTSANAKRVYELAAPDLRTRNEWVTALQKAVEYCNLGGNFQKCELMERERARKARRDKIAEQISGKSMMRKQLQNRDEQLERELQGRMEDKTLLEMREMELEAERLARLGVEARLAEEEAALEAERLRLKELEEIRAMLEKLLEEERQAKRDEEIVRNLQSRLLLEETEKREQLDFLRLEQEKLLQSERAEKEELEKKRQEQAALLESTQHQLNQLALERQQAEQQIQEAEEKMQMAELERQKMQERLRLREMTTSVSLRRPMPMPDPDPFVTHRGKGAFVEADFTKKNPDGTKHPDSSDSGKDSDNTDLKNGPDSSDVKKSPENTDADKNLDDSTDIIRDANSNVTNDSDNVV